MCQRCFAFAKVMQLEKSTKQKHAFIFTPTSFLKIYNIITDNRNKPTAFYDLQGRRLDKPQKGINAINGKKVLVE